MKNLNDNKVKPFLRWAGGKSWFTKNHIHNFLPEKFNDYYEPFLGGGSVFFYLKSKGLLNQKVFLSDTNEELINTYKIIKTSFKDLKKVLDNHKDSVDFYYKIRSVDFDNNIERAARFLYLNKTSFNGIYRVNKLGKYNVPYGNRNLKKLYDFDNLYRVSSLLKGTYLSTKNFKNRLKHTKKDDLVFMDPPYTVAHNNNGFVQYNQSIFSWENQEELSKIVDGLKRNGVNYILTNADHTSIKKLYKNHKCISLERSSTIGGKGAIRKKYKEIIITSNEK